ERLASGNSARARVRRAPSPCPSRSIFCPGCATLVAMQTALEMLVRYGYWVVFGSVLGEQIGLPIPAIPVRLAAGAVIASAQLHPLFVLLAAGIASLIADMVWYSIGRARGARVLGWLCRIALEPDSCVRKTGRMFEAHGARSLLVAKFVPGYST